MAELKMAHKMAELAIASMDDFQQGQVDRVARLIEQEAQRGRREVGVPKEEGKLTGATIAILKDMGYRVTVDEVLLSGRTLIEW